MQELVTYSKNMFKLTKHRSRPKFSTFYLVILHMTFDILMLNFKTSLDRIIHRRFTPLRAGHERYLGRPRRTSWASETPSF